MTIFPCVIITIFYFQAADHKKTMTKTAVYLMIVVSILRLPLSSCKKNVLFLVADDMRPQLGCYDGPDFPSPVHPKMYTPNLDKLAARSLFLKRSHVQQTLCGPSRTSILTGRRPDTTRVYDNQDYFRNVTANFTTIPQYFKEHGYNVYGAGKIFHPGLSSGNDDPISWSGSYYHAPNYEFWEMGSRYSWYAVGPDFRHMRPLPDEEIADYSIVTMERLSKQEKPFFMAVGFHKPHLPFVFPKEFLEKYPEDSIRLPSNPEAPAHMPPVAWWGYSDLRAYGDIKALNKSGAINSTLPDDVVRDLRRAYYSALSYTDSLIGKVLQSLEDLGIANDTIVSFWGDHGWQLGEHGEWEKETNFEVTTHAPMMVHVPGLTDQGVTTRALVEHVDIFPTLVEAAGLPELPLCDEQRSHLTLTCREGSSFLPLAKEPEKEWKNAVFSQFPRHGIVIFDVMGYSVRVDSARYTEWVGFNHTTFTPIWEHINGTELYDHSKDPDENYNRADDPSYAKLRESLRKTLHSGWRHALPDADETLRFVRQKSERHYEYTDHNGIQMHDKI